MQSRRISCRRGRMLPALLLALLFLGAVVFPAAARAAAPATDYDSLRLLTEAFYEVNQKSVFPKSEDDMINGALRGLMNSWTLIPPSSPPRNTRVFSAAGRPRRKPGWN